jgi:hypothetical protein
MVAWRAETVGPARTMSFSVWRPTRVVRSARSKRSSSPSFGRHTSAGCSPGAATGGGAAPSPVWMMRV